MIQTKRTPVTHVTGLEKIHAIHVRGQEKTLALVAAVEERKGALAVLGKAKIIAGLAVEKVQRPKDPERINAKLVVHLVLEEGQILVIVALMDM